MRADQRLHAADILTAALRGEAITCPCAFLLPRARQQQKYEGGSRHQRADRRNGRIEIRDWIVGQIRCDLESVGRLYPNLGLLAASYRRNGGPRAKWARRRLRRLRDRRTEALDGKAEEQGSDDCDREEFRPHHI